MRARFIGYGHVGIKIHEMNEGRRSICKIWCAWLGHGDSEDCNELLLSPKFDFAMLSFSYKYTLGRRATLDEFDVPVSPGSFSEIDELGQPMKKMRKSTSDQLHPSKLISSRSLRRELRKQRQLNAERTCDISNQPMLLGKHAATLFNCKTGKLACSSGNPTGAFHLFHTSCLIHWILLFESETWMSQPTDVKTSTRGRKSKAAKQKCFSMVCPLCQDTGYSY